MSEFVKYDLDPLSLDACPPYPQLPPSTQDILDEMDKQVLERAFQAGIKFAEARIIKLMDSPEFTKMVFDWWNSDAKNRLYEGFLYESNTDKLSDVLIALIKGKSESEPQVSPQQLRINEIFQQANRDIAELAGTMDTLGPKIDGIMAKARADAKAIREGENK